MSSSLTPPPRLQILREAGAMRESKFGQDTTLAAQTAAVILFGAFLAVPVRPRREHFTTCPLKPRPESGRDCRMCLSYICHVFQTAGYHARRPHRPCHLAWRFSRGASLTQEGTPYNVYLTAEA